MISLPFDENLTFLVNRCTSKRKIFLLIAMLMGLEGYCGETLKRGYFRSLLFDSQAPKQNSRI